MRVTDLITIEETRSWKDNDIITITAGTGAGKSYYIKNILYLVAEERKQKILFLIHRSNCKDQFYNELRSSNKTKTIHLMTYQHIESYYLKNNKMLDLSEYNYIVCDEFHYFISDAAFNKTTDISLNTILKQSAVKIFMSATPEIIKGYLNKIKGLETIDYNINIDYNFIDNLYFYSKDDALDYIIKGVIDNNSKAIIFMNNVEKAYKAFTKYKDNCIFNCSSNNSKYYKYVDKELIQDILKNEKFENNILITTSCFDAGINIIDNDLKHIVINGFFDIDIIKQMIGRKRLQNKDDKINIFVRSFSNNQIGGYKTKLNKRIQKAEYFKKNGINKYIDRYYKDSDKTDIIYDAVNEKGELTKKLNELMYYKLKKDILVLDYMLNDKIGYCNYIIDKFNIDKKNYFFIEGDNNKMELNEYLESLTGKELYKEEQKELIKKIDLKVNGRQQKSYSKLNEGLKMLKLPYIIIPKRTSGGRYWIIEKIEE